MTDYANYPGELPAGCPDGSGALTELSFGNGRGDTSATLKDLPLRHGDTLTMSWAGVQASCLGDGTAPAGGVSLAIYRTQRVEFDQMVDEELVAAVDCGTTSTCAGGPRYRLSVAIPSAAEACYVQVDAALGSALGVVGPSGSYYSSSLRGSGPNMLISASNFGGKCEPVPTPTTVTPITTPVVPPAPTPTSAPTPEAPSPKTSTPGNPSEPVQPLAVPTKAQLPATGSANSTSAGFAGLLALAAGGASLVVSRRLGYNSPTV